MRYLTYFFLVVLPLALLGCGGGSSGSTDGAPASYVPPGEDDDYYLFYSGGHSGQVFVAGLPSLREIQEIPVYTPSPGHGYGFDEESKEMMGEYRWGDVHHPGLSKTDGVYDGRWLFVNDNANNRVARISL
ncbi:MAG: nitrous-oxide reductase, partial [Salinibacter sp.]